MKISFSLILSSFTLRILSRTSESLCGWNASIRADDRQFWKYGTKHRSAFALGSASGGRGDSPHRGLFVVVTPRGSTRFSWGLSSEARMAGDRAVLRGDLCPIRWRQLRPNVLAECRRGRSFWRIRGCKERPLRYLRSNAHGAIGGR
jgi:hypothetical protein